MSGRRVNPNRIKLNRSYTVTELAATLGKHKNAVRQWQRDGLATVDDQRPLLFQGAAVRAFLEARNAGRKRPCPPGTFYCFRCREPRRPALGMVDYIESQPAWDNLRAICATCETIMHRRVRRTALSTAMPGVAVQFKKAEPRLVGPTTPSLNSDTAKQRMTP